MVGFRPALEVPAPGGGSPGVAGMRVGSLRIDPMSGTSSLVTRENLVAYLASRGLGESEAVGAGHVGIGVGTFGHVDVGVGWG